MSSKEAQNKIYFTATVSSRHSKNQPKMFNINVLRAGAVCNTFWNYKSRASCISHTYSYLPAKFRNLILREINLL